jgi:MFS family permease
MKLQARMQTLTRGLPPAYWLLFAGTLINRLGGLVIPFLTLYLTVRRSIPAGQAALMVSLFGAGSFVAQMTGGELTDRLGRRPVMLMSFFLAPPAMVVLGLVQGLLPIAVCTFAVGFFTDLYRPAMSAAVADLVAPADRTRGYGYIYWAINLGAAIAPIVAGFLAGASYFLLFVADAATTLVFGLIVLFGFPETRPAEAQHRASHAPVRERMSQLRASPVLLVFSLLTLLTGIIYAQHAVTLPLAMTASGLAPSHYGLAISVNGFLIILTTIPLTALAARWPRFLTVAVSSVFVGLGFGFTAFASTLPLYMVSVAIWTVGELLTNAVAPTIIADLAPVALRGLFQGIFGSAWGLSLFLGPVIGGYVYQVAGGNVLWAGCLGLGLVVAVAMLALGRRAARTARAP